jgi:hypothetical protein
VPIEFPGKMPHGELMGRIKSCHACIAPALTEFNPNYILEGASYGKPYLINRENGLTLLTPKEFTFDVANKEELENKLLWLYSKEGYVAARKLVAGILPGPTWDEVVKKNLDLIKKTCES